MRYCPLPYLILFMTFAVLTACQRDGVGTDYHTEAFEFYGEYNGAIGNNGEHNYFICLADDTFDAQGAAKPGASYYYFDIFSSPSVPGSDITVPPGRYVLGVPGATNVGTFTPNYSLFVGNDRSGKPIELTFSNGILNITLTEAGMYEFTAELTDLTGMTHYVHYIGPAVLSDNSQGIIDGYQPLASDLDIQAHAANATLYDMDGLGDGISNVILSFTDMELDAEGYAIPPGSILNIDCYMRLTDDGRIPAGIYDIAADWGQRDSTLSPGEEINGQLVGTLVEHYDDNSNAYLGLITEGSLYIMNSAGLQYDIMYVFHTDTGYEITGNYNGSLDLITATAASIAKDRPSLHRPVPSPLTRQHYKVRMR